MAITELQKERVSFHLHFVSSKYILAISRNITLGSLNASQELALVGQSLELLDPLNVFSFEGIPLCSITSALGKVERAYANLSPSVIEDSLYVSQAGSVSLRGTELRKREELYKKMVEHMGQLLGSETYDRVGW